jgi:hypothetical protein
VRKRVNLWAAQGWRQKHYSKDRINIAMPQGNCRAKGPPNDPRIWKSSSVNFLKCSPKVKFLASTFVVHTLARA